MSRVSNQRHFLFISSLFLRIICSRLLVTLRPLKARASEGIERNPVLLSRRKRFLWYCRNSHLLIRTSIYDLTLSCAVRHRSAAPWWTYADALCFVVPFGRNRRRIDASEVGLRMDVPWYHLSSLDLKLGSVRPYHLSNFSKLLKIESFL